MMSATKLEVHNVLQYCQRRTEPHPQSTCTNNLVKFGCVVFEICMDRQTNSLQYFTPLLEQSNDADIIW